MRLIRALSAVALAGAMAWSAVALDPRPAVAADPDEQRIGEILEKILRERPEIIVEALRAYQEREEAAEKERQKQQLSDRTDELFGKDSDPFIGNPNGTVTMVEFFDYRCGYCKRVMGDVIALTEANKDLKVVFKEFPILGDASVIASRVSLAVNLVAPENYAEFHKRVMSDRGSPDRQALLKIAGDLGIDTAAVEAQIDSREVAAVIRDNYLLAEQLGIRGTPAFVIGDTIIPGAADRSTLERLIADQRG